MEKVEIADKEKLVDGLYDYLMEIAKRPDNRTLYGNIKIQSIFRNKDTSYYIWNDLDLLKEIDSFNLTSTEKLFFYFSYEPYITTKEELYNQIVNSSSFIKNLNIDNPYILDYKVKNILYKIIKKKLKYKIKIGYSSLDVEILKFFSYKKAKIERIEKLYLVNTFLNNAEDNETYQEYYKKHPEITGVFKEDGTIDFSLFVKTPYIKKLVKIFVSGFYGTMGENIQKGVNKKLEEIPKETYIKLIEQAGLKSGTLKNLNSILQNIQKPTKNRTFDKNAELISRVILEKMIANDNINVFEFYEFLNETSKLTYNESLYIDNISTKIVDIIIENKDKLSLSDAISLFCAIKYPKQWVRTGSYFDCLNFLLNSLEKDCRGTAVLISYVELFYEKEQPSMSEWKQIISDDLVNVVPHVALSIVAKSNKDYNYSGFSL